MKFTKRVFSVALMLVILLTAVPFTAFNALAIDGSGAPTDLNYYVCGIDISEWQGSSVDFAALKASGCEFVILRIGYATTLDNCFMNNYSRARAAGMPLGVYLYSHATTYSGSAAEAKWAINIFESNDMYFEYPIFIDIETSSQNALSASGKESLVAGWCETMVNAGYFPGIYAGKSQFIEHLSSATRAKYDLWVPAVAQNAGDETKWQYTYDYIDYNAQGYSMWQYSWSNYNPNTGGYIYEGIGSISLDLDVCYKDYPAIMAQYGWNNCGSNEKAKLQTLVDAAKSIDRTDYSESAIADIRTAYDEAVALLNNVNSSDDDCAAAAQKLDNALANKVKILSVGKAYTANDANRGDIFDDDGVRLTDGERASLDGGEDGYSGWQGESVVTVDLGSNMTSDTYTAYVAAGTWGIALPMPGYFTVEVQASSDNVNFTTVAVSGDIVHTGGATKYTDSTWATFTVTAKASSTVNARYIRFVVKNEQCIGFIWMDEVEVSLGDTSVSGGVYVSGVDTRVEDGDCIIFTPDYDGTGVITVSNASITWTTNVVAKWDTAEGAYKIKEISYGSGPDTPDIALADDEILIAAHAWEHEEGVTNPVAGSDANVRQLQCAKVGDVVKFYGLDITNGYMSAGAYIKFFAPGALQTTEFFHINPLLPTCTEDGYCNACKEFLTPALGHTDGEWITLSDGSQQLDCSVCGVVIDTKEAPADEPIYDGNGENKDDEAIYRGLRGDINNSSDIDMMDYILLKRAYFGTFALDEDQTYRADIDEDNAIEMMDYILLKRAYFGTFNINNPYVYK